MQMLTALARKFFRKKDEVLVAFYHEGNHYIYKNGLPHIRMYMCYENEAGERRVVESGSYISGNTTLHDMLMEWKNRQVFIPSIPYYKHVVSGQPFEGADKWKQLSDNTLSICVKRMR